MNKLAEKAVGYIYSVNPLGDGVVLAHSNAFAPAAPRLASDPTDGAAKAT
jgi:hypothetical protein